MSFIGELKRRNVIRAGVAYLAGAWLLVQILETLFPIFGLAETSIRIVVVILAIAFIPVVVGAWIFEITPEGLVRDSGEAGGGTASNARFDRIIIAMLALAVVVFAVHTFVLDPRRDAAERESAREEGRSAALIESFGDKSIVVLPFDNVSADPEKAYFADGIAETLLNLLSRIPELRVTSRSSSFALKDKNLTVPEIAERLNATLVLEGSVNRIDDVFRITARLIDARSDTQLWSDSYDAKMEDLFVVQDEISAAIVEALRKRLDEKVSNAPRATAAANQEAYAAYLLGLHLIAQRSEDSGRRAVLEFKKAVSLDPDFAPAHAELALAVGRRTLGDQLSRNEIVEMLAYHVPKAMELDATLPEVHAARGWMLEMLSKSDEAEAEFRRAIELNPSYAEARVWLAEYLDDPADSFANLESALLLDPLSRPGNFNYIDGLIARNRLNEAERWIEKLATFEPAGAILFQGKLDALGGKWSRAALAYLQAAKDEPDRLVYGSFYKLDFRWTLAAVGLWEEAMLLQPDFPQVMEAWFGKAEIGVEIAEARLREDSRQAYNTGMVLAHVGQFDRARQLLEGDWENWSQSESDSAISGDGMYEARYAEALVAMRRQSGNESGAQEVINAMVANVHRLRDAGITMTSRTNSVDYHAGIAAWLAGDRDKGLALIGQAVEDGFWIPPMAAFQKALFEDPGFAPIRAVNDEREARERARILNVVCNDNPYADVWQPMPETCEAHEAATGN